MKALTLHQPWATLIAIGAKHIETRSWSTSYRGPLAIHASTNRQYLRYAAAMAQWAGLLWWRFPKPEELPLGAVVAIAELVDCVRMTEENIRQIPADELRFGHFAPGRYMWVLNNVRPLDNPVPARGRQGLWEWDDGGKR